MEGKRLIAVVDYHKGNLKSVERGLVGVGADARITDDPRQIADASAIVLPGVGAFADAAASMRELGQMDLVRERIKAGVPFLGICLGLQVLFTRGSEHAAQSNFGGEWVPGLGVLRGSVTRLESSTLKVPHVGWDQAHLSEHGLQCPLFVDVPDGANLYFTHSYALADDVDADVVAARTHYARSFCSAVWRDNVFGVQFHPEKSSRVGLALLRNFVNVARG
jgi:glutamine amidotransferase